MIASHGVTQPHVWNYWKECAPDDIDIVFRVHSFRQIEHGKRFCETHRVRDERSEKVYMDDATRWGSFRLLYETLMAMYHISREFRDRPYILMIVSGTDIPVCGIRQWLMENSPVSNYVGMQDDTMVHSQWMTLGSEIVETIFHRLSFHDERSRRLHIIDMFKIIHEFLKEKKRKGFAPDEVWLNCVGFTRRELDTYFSSSHIVLPFYHLLDSLVSPIQWSDFQKEQYIQNTEYSRWFTLKQALLFTSRTRTSEPSILFFRKVMSSVKIPELFLKRLYQQTVVQKQSDTPIRRFDEQTQFTDEFFQIVNKIKDTHDKKQSHGRRLRKSQYQSSFSFVPQPLPPTPKHSTPTPTPKHTKYSSPTPKHFTPTHTKYSSPTSKR